MSNASVVFEGKEYTLESAVRKGVTDIQQYLNDLECYMMQLANSEVLDEDEDEDFKMMLEKVEKADDAIDDMIVLFDGLKDVSMQILGPAPKGVKAWYKAHKEERKNKMVEARAERKAAQATAKAFAAEKAKLDDIAE